MRKKMNELKKLGGSALNVPQIAYEIISTW
jgi:hypothetical protein